MGDFCVWKGWTDKVVRFFEECFRKSIEKSKQYCHALLDFTMQSYVKDNVVLHFGI